MRPRYICILYAVPVPGFASKPEEWCVSNCGGGGGGVLKLGLQLPGCVGKRGNKYDPRYFVRNTLRWSTGNGLRADRQEYFTALFNQIGTVKI